MSNSRIERMLNEVRVNSYWKIAVLTIVAAAVGLVVGLTSMTSGETTAADTQAQPIVGGEFSYFPGQYVNKATGPSDHIQAF